MAFLHKFPNRPACIVSALPKRYREPLERELAGSVAISTCPVEELESMVKMRGAAMAVVGVTGDSLDVAERLSHGPRDIKVFLAHYKEPAKALTNGFAGVFDLRIEPERLAATIRKSVSDLNRNYPIELPCPQLQRQQLARFLEMQKRLTNRSALFESVLTHVLQVAEAKEGILVTPTERIDRFQVVASCGDESPTVGTEFVLDRFCIKSLHAGRIAAIEKIDHLDQTEALFATSEFGIAIPIVSNGRLSACILANHANQSPDLYEIVGGVGFLFEQLTRKEAKAAREDLLSNARNKVGSGWILSDRNGRVLYREGRDGSWISQHKPRIEEPRLLDLIRQTFSGKKVHAKIRGRVITGQTLTTESGCYCILETKEAFKPSDRLSLGSEGLLLTAVLRQALPNSSIERSLFELLIKCQTDGKVITFPVQEMEENGFLIKPTWGALPTDLAAGIGLVVLIAKVIAGKAVTASYEQSSSEWFLTVELPEDKMSEKIIQWNEEPLLLAAIRISELNNATLSSGLYGFRLTGKLRSRL